MWDCRAYPTERHDGDTFRVMADTMFGQRYEPALRLQDVRAPELRQLGGPETTQYVDQWLTRTAARLSAVRWPLYVVTTKTRTLEPNQRTTLERYLAVVWPIDKGTPGVPGSYPVEDSLNYAVTQFLAGHQDWPSGM